MSTNLKDEHRSSPSARQSPELLPRRRKRTKSRSSRTLPKDEIKFQRFVRDLSRDMWVPPERSSNGFSNDFHRQFSMGQSRRENGFDQRDHRSYNTDPSIRVNITEWWRKKHETILSGISKLLRTTLKSRQSPTRSTSRQTDHMETTTR